MIVNPGNVYSEPLITVYGSGDIHLTVGSYIVSLEDITDNIALDCRLMEAYRDYELMNEHMTGDFPRLRPGSNVISWTGNVSRVVIQPRWRYL